MEDTVNQPIVFSLMSSIWAKFHPTNRNNVYYIQDRRQDFAEVEPIIAGGGIL